MTSRRPYRKAQSHTQALEELLRARAKQLDPQIVDVFVSLRLEESVSQVHEEPSSAPVPGPVSALGSPLAAASAQGRGVI
jgi:HD-GYP domain-containing protein (c-di-GMP phosphodiesterase class II)